MTGPHQGGEELAWLRVAHRILARLDAFSSTDHPSALSTLLDEEAFNAEHHVASFYQKRQTPDHDNSNGSGNSNKKKKAQQQQQQRQMPYGTPAECGLPGHYGHTKARCLTLQREAANRKKQGESKD